jgi:hypothetical protein
MSVTTLYHVVNHVTINTDEVPGQSVAREFFLKIEMHMHQTIGLAVTLVLPASAAAHYGAQEAHSSYAAPTSFGQFRFGDPSEAIALVAMPKWYDRPTISPGKH